MHRPLRLHAEGQGLRALSFSRYFILILLLAVLPATVRAADEQWQVGVTPSVSTGKYGRDTSTDIVYTPAVARRLFADGDLAFVFPFICITGDAGVAIIGGTPVRTEPVSTAGTATRASTSSRSSGAATLPATPAPTPPSRTCGVGDIIVRGRYYMLDERAWMPTIAVRAHVKAPTASAERGLGTGRADEGVGVELSRTVGRGFVAMADAGYTNIGNPEGGDYRDTWWYDIGAAQDIAGGRVNLSAFFEQYRAIVPGFVDARDVLASVTVKGRSGWSVEVTGQLGLSDGAADYGIVVGASRRF